VTADPTFPQRRRHGARLLVQFQEKFMNIRRVLCTLVAVVCFSSVAWAVPVTFEKLTGVTGGAPAATAVFKADLSSIGIANILSMTITDDSAPDAGSPGQFSGFDLDAVILSLTDCADAACAQGLAGLNVFNFSPAGTFFTPGVQRVPVDPKLFGTGVAGNTVDNAVATLAALDGNSTTAIPGADGFVSLGDGGVLSFNLTSLVSTEGLFLYIGEVGDNGEVVDGSITVSDRPVVPEPALLALFGVGLIGLSRRRLMRR
jgi:hypothetical protein